MSALVGQPPNTQNDYYIVRGFLRTVGLSKVDPALGYTRAAKRPYDGYTYTSRQPGILAGLTIVLIAIIVSTGMRLYLRAAMSQMRFGADDWATIAAAAMGITYTVCQIIMATKGGGNHIYDATYEDYKVFNYYGVLDKPIFYVTVGFIKVSLTLFIRRLSDRSSSRWKWFCDVFLVTLVIYILAAIFWEAFSCYPAQSQWDKLYAGQLETGFTCINLSTQSKVLNITHVVQGTMLLLSPVIILWTVQMDRAKKTRLFVIWFTGLIAVLCGLMRHLRADFTADVMWDYTELLVWTALDVCIGIITISLPVMDAWLAGAWRTVVTSRSRGKGGSSYADMGGAGSGSGSRAAKEAGKGPGGISLSLSSSARHRYGNGTTTRSTAGVASPRNDSDSMDEIIRKDDDTELRTIVRTDEYNVFYSSADYGGSEDDLEPARIYDKDRVTGIGKAH